jgi:hypothetical protein
MKYLKHYKIFEESEPDDKMEFLRYFDILSIKDGDDIVDPTARLISICVDNGDRTEDDNIEIYSVKRKADGEIFTVGDNLGLSFPGNGVKPFENILKIWPSFNQIRYDSNGGGCPLNHFFIVKM